MLQAIYLFAALLLPPVAVAGNACPASFEEYLSVFQGDASFQQRHTRYPLRYSFVDTDAEPEPKVIKRHLTRAQAAKERGVSYPSRELVKADGLVRKVVATKSAGYLVRFDHGDSDVFSIEFRFLRHQGCWQLIAVDDMSL